MVYLLIFVTFHYCWNDYSRLVHVIRQLKYLLVKWSIYPNIAISRYLSTAAVHSLFYVCLMSCLLFSQDSESEESEEEHQTEAEKRKARAVARIAKRRVESEKKLDPANLRAPVVSCGNVL